MASVQPCATSSANFALASGENKRVLLPALGLVDVEVGRNDVEIADQQRRHAAVEQALGVRLQPVHPRQLVVELGAGPRIAVGQIEVADQQPADRRLDIAAVARVGIAGQAAAGFDGLADAAQDGDSVPAFLAVPDGRIAGVARCFGGERFVGAFELLEARRCRAGTRQPAQQDRQPRIDPVDIVAGDAQAALAPRLSTGLFAAVAFPPCVRNHRGTDRSIACFKSSERSMTPPTSVGYRAALASSRCSRRAPGAPPGSSNGRCGNGRAAGRGRRRATRRARRPARRGARSARFSVVLNGQTWRSWTAGTPGSAPAPPRPRRARSRPARRRATSTPIP